jgi:hypothetical protein
VVAALVATGMVVAVAVEVEVEVVVVPGLVFA